MLRIEKIYNLFLECKNISTDSRNITSFSQNGNKVIFFALKGDNFDGNKFVEKALAEGATYCIADDLSLNDNPRVVVVGDVLTTLQNLANYHRKQLSTKIFSVTGSNGKTTTKELLYAVLSKKYKTVATVGNLNNHIGVPLTLLSIPTDCQIAIVEMGANHPKEIAQLCGIAEPDYGLITNIGKAHLEGFGSQQGVAKAKGEMFDFLSTNGFIFYDDSCSWLSALAKDFDAQRKIAYRTLSVNFSEGSSGELVMNYKGVLYHTKLIGDYNRFNVASAVEVGLYFGVNEQEIKQAIESYEPTLKRSQLIECQTNTIVLDAYNANPSSMELSINNFAKMKDQNKILILGDMKELGEHTLNEHIQILKQVEKLGFEKVYIVGEYFVNALKKYNISAKSFENTTNLITFIKNSEIINHTILIKGSNSMKLDSIVDFLRR